MIEWLSPRRSAKRRPIILTVLIVIALAVAFVVFGRGEARAQDESLATRTQWLRQPEASRLAYVLGLADALTIPWSGETPDLEARRLGLQDCFVELDLTTSELAQMIDDGYLAQPERWNETPRVIFIGRLFAVCRPFINQRRVAVGLEGLPATP